MNSFLGMAVVLFAGMFFLAMTMFFFASIFFVVRMHLHERLSSGVLRWA